MNEIQKTFKKKLNEKVEKMENKLLQQYEKKEDERDKKFNDSIIMKSSINIQNSTNENNSKLSNIKVIHSGFKCEKCSQEPIVGNRYKCSICDNYNLCEKCEEENSKTDEHLHNFIKIRKEEKNNEENNIKDNEDKKINIIVENIIEENTSENINNNNDEININKNDNNSNENNINDDINNNNNNIVKDSKDNNLVINEIIVNDDDNNNNEEKEANNNMILEKDNNNKKDDINYNEENINDNMIIENVNNISDENNNNNNDENNNNNIVVLKIENINSNNDDGEIEKDDEKKENGDENNSNNNDEKMEILEKKDDEKKMEIKENIILLENEDEEVENQYSYECITNIINLSAFIYEGTDDANIEIILKNNGDQPWPKDKTKLIYDKESYSMGKDIILNPQNPGEEQKYVIIINNLGKCPSGEYKFFMYFCVDSKIFGEKLSFRVIIKEENKNKIEIKEHFEKIKEFRENFGLNNEDFSDEDILNALKANNFNFEETFAKLFN